MTGSVRSPEYYSQSHQGHQQQHHHREDRRQTGGAQTAPLRPLVLGYHCSGRHWASPLGGSVGELEDDSTVALGRFSARLILMWLRAALTVWSNLGRVLESAWG